MVAIGNGDSQINLAKQPSSFAVNLVIARKLAGLAATPCDDSTGPDFPALRSFKRIISIGVGAETHEWSKSECREGGTALSNPNCSSLLC